MKELDSFQTIAPSRYWSSQIITDTNNSTYFLHSHHLSQFAKNISNNRTTTLKAVSLDSLLQCGCLPGTVSTIWNFGVCLFTVGPWCFSYFNKTGGKYRGRVNVTATGKPCKLWDNESMQNVGLDPEGFPDSSLEEAANFCRNPNGSAWPWCYTMTVTRWEYCAIEDIVCRTFHIR